MNSLLYQRSSVFFVTGAVTWLASTNLSFEGAELALILGDLDWDLRDEREHGLEVLLHSFSNLVESKHLFLSFTFSELSYLDVSD